MKILFLFFVFLLSYPLFSDENALKRIHAHLIISDPTTACIEASKNLSQNSDNQSYFEAYIKALSMAGNESRLIAAVQDYLIRFPESKLKNEVLEHLSWGVIENARNSSAPMIRVFALLGAFFANDAKGVKIIHKALLDPNSFLRGAALQLSTQLRDSKIQNQVLRLAKQEPLFVIRLTAIKALGSMKTAESKETLEKIIASNTSEYEEKVAAIKSLSQIMDTAKRQEIEFLTKSPFSYHRLLACELVLNQELVSDIDLIIPLLKDNQRDIRRAALELIGVLRIDRFSEESILNQISPLLQDMDSQVAVTAAYVLLLNDNKKGSFALKPYFTHEQKEIRLLAASALAKSGKYGLNLMKEIFHETEDPYIKINLSLGLIGQREMTESAAHGMYEKFSEIHEKVTWIECGIFRYFAPSHMEKDELFPNEKEAKNQIARLEILNILSILQYKKAEEGIKNFLQENKWGVSAMASLLLLSEGDESAIDLVKHLTKDPDEKIRIQAALVLSLWDSCGEGLSMLQEFYPTADREMKERILEGVGRIGSTASIPFLLECMNEPFQSLRIIAASAMLQTLYH